MSKLSQACQAAVLAAGILAVGAAGAQEANVNDPHLWLEEVEGEKALDWVRARNAEAEAELAATPQFRQLEADIRAILDSDAKIPGVQKIGQYYYNF